MMTLFRRILVIVTVAFMTQGLSLPLCARPGRGVPNRVYADMRSWHLGFSVGIHVQDLVFTHNGFITDNGESWFMEQPGYSPGFCVNGLLDLRLNSYFNLRFTPGMYFGSRSIYMRDAVGGYDERQSIKTNMLVMPVDLRFSSLRYRNIRPYLTTGILAAVDVSRSRPRELLRLKSTDFMLSAGFGCDIYLPYFKLSPELKFCFGLTDVLSHKRADLIDDPDRMKFTQSIAKAMSRMIVLTFYFE